MELRVSNRPAGDSCHLWVGDHVGDPCGRTGRGATLWHNLVIRDHTPLASADWDSRYRDELGPGQEAAQVAGGRLAEHSRLGGALENLPLVVQEGFREGLRSREKEELQKN